MKGEFEKAIKKYKWLKRAFRFIGEKEIRGQKHNQKILDMWIDIGLTFKTDETPWCAAFVGSVLEISKMKSTGSGMARSYETWGQELAVPAIGCIVVFWRGKKKGKSGHVGFVVGKDTKGRLMVLGGNQGDMVSIRPFNVNRVLSYRWPDGVKIPLNFGFETLPTVYHANSVSLNEA